MLMTIAWIMEFVFGGGLHSALTGRDAIPPWQCTCLGCLGSPFRWFIVLVTALPLGPSVEVFTLRQVPGSGTPVDLAKAARENLMLSKRGDVYCRDRRERGLSMAATPSSGYSPRIVAMTNTRPPRSWMSAAWMTGCISRPYVSPRMSPPVGRALLAGVMACGLSEHSPVVTSWWHRTRPILSLCKKGAEV